MKIIPWSAALWFALGAVASAQDTIPAKLAGYDGVVSQCVVHTKKAFAKTMCDALAKAAGAEAGKADIRHVHLGSADWTDGPGAYLEPSADAGFQKPLYLTFYLRGTDGNPAGAHAWASLYARQDDAELPGRLVLWEGATLGSGPPKAVAAAVANAVAEKMKPVFKALGEAMAD